MSLSKRLLCLSFLFLSCSILKAQNYEKELMGFYLEQRYILADANGDNLLDLSEMLAFETEFAYYLEKKNFEKADENNDQHISFYETVRKAEAEFGFREYMEQKAYRNYCFEHPLLQRADKDYLKNNPVLTAKLLSNVYWMQQHPDLCMELSKSTVWLAKNKEVKKALTNNLAWLVCNPVMARKLYKKWAIGNDSSPLMSWVSSHQDFIDRQDILSQVGYQMSALSEIKLGLLDR